MGIGDFLSGIPVIGGAFDDSDDQAIAQLRENQKLWQGLKVPDLQWEQYQPEGFTYAGDYTPEMAAYEQISEDPLVRSAQMSALSKMAGLADTGLSEVDELGYLRAGREGAKVAQNARESALSNARARGIAGSGLEFALREMGAQSGANRAQEAALEQAATAAKQRALYNEAYLSGMGSMRDQDYRSNAANTGIINQFNMANTNARNEAQQANLGNRQQLSNANVQQRNQAQQYNQEGRRNTTQQNFDNQVTKTSGMTGANQGVAQGYAAKNAANQESRNANTDLLAKGIDWVWGGKK